MTAHQRRTSPKHDLSTMAGRKVLVLIAPTEQIALDWWEHEFRWNRVFRPRYADRWEEVTGRSPAHSRYHSLRHAGWDDRCQWLEGRAIDQRLPHLEPEWLAAADDDA